PLQNRQAIIQPPITVNQSMGKGGGAPNPHLANAAPQHGRSSADAAGSHGVGAPRPRRTAREGRRLRPPPRRWTGPYPAQPLPRQSAVGAYGRPSQINWT